MRIKDRIKRIIRGKNLREDRGYVTPTKVCYERRYEITELAWPKPR